MCNTVTVGRTDTMEPCIRAISCIYHAVVLLLAAVKYGCRSDLATLERRLVSFVREKVFSGTIERFIAKEFLRNAWIVDIHMMPFLRLQISSNFNVTS